MKASSQRQCGAVFDAFQRLLHPWHAHDASRLMEQRASPSFRTLGVNWVRGRKEAQQDCNEEAWSIHGAKDSDRFNRIT